MLSECTNDCSKLLKDKRKINKDNENDIFNHSKDNCRKYKKCKKYVSIKFINRTFKNLTN